MTMTQSERMNRRTFMKTVGLAAGGGAAVSTQSPVSPIGDADALLGTVALIGGSLFVGAAAGWTVRHFEVIGADDPPEGLTTDVLKTSIYQSAAKRKSNNESTFIDNRNIVNYLPEKALSDAKNAGIEALNNGKTESEVHSAAQSAANAHYATVEANLLNSWNESANEAVNMAEAVKTHGSLTLPDVFYTSFDSDSLVDGSYSNQDIRDLYLSPTSITLRDGSSFTLDALEVDWYDSGTGNSFETRWSPLNVQNLNVGSSWTGGDPSNIMLQVLNPSGGVIEYMDYTPGWSEVWSDIQSVFDQVDSDIASWVSTTYGAVQSGEIDISDLVTATDLANSGDIPQVIADFAANNLPADFENQLTITTSDGSTLVGYLATTDSDALSSVSPGDTIDPNATDQDGNPLYGTIYMAHDVGEWRYDWQHYDAQKDVDGGVVWFTKDPKSEVPDVDSSLTIYHTIETGAGESVTVKASDFTETTDGGGTTIWEIDLSDQLETDITTIEKVTTELEVDTYTVAVIDQRFTVRSTMDGGAVNLTQNTQPQDDTNYTTQDEWDQYEKQTQDLIDKFNEANSDDGGDWFGGGGVLGGTDIGSLLSTDTLLLIGAGILGLAGINAASS